MFPGENSRPHGRGSEQVSVEFRQDRINRRESFENHHGASWAPHARIGHGEDGQRGRTYGGGKVGDPRIVPDVGDRTVENCCDLPQRDLSEANETIPGVRTAALRRPEENLFDGVFIRRPFDDHDDHLAFEQSEHERREAFGGPAFSRTSAARMKRNEWPTINSHTIQKPVCHLAFRFRERKSRRSLLGRDAERL